MGWALVVIINLFMAFYILLFGVKHGAKTTNQWLLSFIGGAFQDPLLNMPLVGSQHQSQYDHESHVTTHLLTPSLVYTHTKQVILYWHVFMPVLVKDRLDVALDSANKAPYIFSTFIPTGPACR